MAEEMRCMVADAEERMDIINRILNHILHVPEDASPEEREMFERGRTKKVSDDKWMNMSMEKLREIEAFYERMQGGHA